MKLFLSVKAIRILKSFWLRRWRSGGAQVQRNLLAAESAFFSATATEHLALMLEVLKRLVADPYVAFLCPIVPTRAFHRACEIALTAGDFTRGRALLQVGNMFKLQAMSRWWNEMPPNPTGASRRFHTQLQVRYLLGLPQLQERVGVQPKSLAPARGALPNVEVHSICVYKDDPTSNTGVQSPLPQWASANHRAYAAKHGLEYVLHTELLLPDREAHYSKMLVVYQRLQQFIQAFSNPQYHVPEWILFIDCDAFFTNFDIAVEDIIDAYGSPSTQFMVAEDTGGINTGVFLARRSQWTLDYLARVAVNPFTIAWDQSMFFMEILMPGLLDSTKPFALPTEVGFVHQKHLNAFVPPASRDWLAYEWQPGDFIRHFAGCPWQEKPCYEMMAETAQILS